MPIKLCNWTARRSGSTISVTGFKCSDHEKVTIAGVAALGPRDGKLSVTSKDGQQWELVI